MKKSLLGFLGSLPVLTVAWSIVQARPNEALEMNQRPDPSGTQVVPGNCTQLIESTGFEDGLPYQGDWEAVFQICGPEFDDGDCTDGAQPPICNPPGPTENCCSDFPNVNNCWFVSSASQSCTEPHIDSVNPFNAGGQHLRLQADTSGGGSLGAFTPIQNISTPGPTHIEFMLNGSAGPGSALHFRAFDDSGGGPVSGNIAVYMFFETNAGVNEIYVNDYNNSGSPKTLVGTWTPGVYEKVEIDINPCCETGFTQTYTYGPTLLHSHSTVPYVSSVERANWLYFTNSGTKTWDVDDYIITRGTACLSECPPSTISTTTAFGFVGTLDGFNGA